PVIVNYLREYQLEHGVPRAQVYDITAYILCGLLAVGFLCNLMIKPVADHHFMTEEELERARQAAHDTAARANGVRSASDDEPTPSGLVVLVWLLVGVPIAWGVWITLEKAWVLFR